MRAARDKEPDGFSIDRVDLPEGHELVVMTYDDGPQAGGTDLILDALDEFGARATFFVLMSRVERERALVAEILVRGHELGLHGQNHRRLSTLSLDTATKQIRQAKARLEDIASREVEWFRPPYGDQTITSWRATISAGLTPVMWTVEARDWADIPSSERVAAAAALDEPGGIILCHDGFPDTSDGVDDPKPPPPFDRGELTRQILRNYAQGGLNACSLGEAAAIGCPHMRVWLNRDDTGRGKP
jgi:peptidoglycan/xylan/chitin deacetylase (PgdA/CDA1 family)